MNTARPVLGVVGPCASGKSTLVDQLRSRGYQVKHIAQEHSYVKDMWKRIAQPDILIYLDVSYEVSCGRSQSNWSKKIFNLQLERLQHARKHADLYVDTNDKKPAEVLDLVIKTIEDTIGEI